MGKPAARVGDMHMCPMVTPGLPPIPHVGGPITGPGCPTVLIGGMPAAVMGDMCVCVGPPSTVVLGSTGVFIGGKPAARMGDMTAHGGTITVGCPTVLIGETSPGTSSSVGAGSASAGSNTPTPGSVPPAPTLPKPILAEVMADMPPAAQAILSQIISFREAAAKGTFFAHNAETCPVCAKKAKQKKNQSTL